MIKKYNITAIICALVLAIGNLGIYADNAKAVQSPVTSDDAPLFREEMEQGAAKNARTGNRAQELRFGKKLQGKLVSGDDGQQYQITLKSSGQLDIQLEGDSGKLATRLTDKAGKGWAPRRRTADGKQIYQLKKGTYHVQVQAAKGAQIPETGLDYAVTATFKSAKAKFEGNSTRKKAAKLPFHKVFYGHLASNEPVEYYKFTLDKQSYFSFSLTTQITDYAPETFVVTLYNKHGQRISSGWESPDWVEIIKDTADIIEYKFEDGYWYEGDICGTYDRGPLWVLMPGDYYVGVSVKRDKDGKVPAAARYGRYAAFAAFWRPFVSVGLSSKQAEYTGKKIAAPKVNISVIKEEGNVWPDVRRKSGRHSRYLIFGMTAGTGDSLKKIGRYMIVQNMWWVDPEFYSSQTDAYAIFTITPTRGKISRASSRKPGEMQVSVRKNAQSTGYQLQVARDKKFRKQVKTLKTKNLRETLKGLSSGKKYYVRVRNYKDVKTGYHDIDIPESIYGKWSRTKAVVCK